VVAATAAAVVVGYLTLRPRAVAELTQATADVVWQDPVAAPHVGAMLHAGETLRLRQGRALATFVSGAQIILEGPVEVRVKDDNRIWLESGRLGAAVPPQAMGLIVDSPLAQFVDMGTKFTIDLAPTTGCQIQVFDGMVEVRPADDSPLVRVSEGSAISYDAATGDVGFVPYDEGHQLSL
jgi:hypothetical protein